MTFKELLEKQSAMKATSTQRLEIQTLKEQLTSTDYKVIKCSEYSLANLDAPYDITALHTERQALRDKINSLEIEIAAV